MTRKSQRENKVEDKRISAIERSQQKYPDVTALPKEAVKERNKPYDQIPAPKSKPQVSTLNLEKKKIERPLKRRKPAVKSNVERPLKRRKPNDTQLALPEKKPKSDAIEKTLPGKLLLIITFENLFL